MEIRKLMLGLFFFFPLLNAEAQNDDGQYIHKGILRAQITFSAGDMLNYSEANNLYLHGDWGFYLDNQISLRGDGYMFVNSIGENKVVDMNHSVFAGGIYHFKTNGHFDPHIGFQPGVAMSRTDMGVLTKDRPETTVVNEPSFSPLVSGLVGINYFGPKFFHVFFQIRYVQGRQISDYAPVALDELRYSFGLGWNLNLIKQD